MQIAIVVVGEGRAADGAVLIEVVGRVLASEFAVSRNGLSEALRKAREEAKLADELSGILNHPVAPWELDRRSMELLIEFGQTLKTLLDEEDATLKWLERWLLRQPMMGPVKVAGVLAYL